MSGRYLLVALPTLWIAGGLQEALAPRMAVAGSSPDFLLVALAALALLGDRKSGLLTGFVAGLLRGVLAGTNLAVYAIGRMLLGFGLGWIRSAGLVPNALVAGLAAAGGTLFAQGALMLVAHRGPVLPFLGGTLFSAVIDGALAIPLYASLRRLIEPANDR